MVAKRALNKKVENKFLDNLIEGKKAKFGVTCDISKGTIWTQIWCEHHDPKHPEEAFVVICIQMGTIWQQLLVREGVVLMNSLINGTNFQKELVEFQMVQKFGWDTYTYGEVGKGWWQGFLKRNGYCIVTQRGEKFAVDRLD